MIPHVMAINSTISNSEHLTDLTINVYKRIEISNVIGMESTSDSTLIVDYDKDNKLIDAYFKDERPQLYLFNSRIL